MLQVSLSLLPWQSQAQQRHEQEGTERLEKDRSSPIRDVHLFKIKSVVVQLGASCQQSQETAMAATAASSSVPADKDQAFACGTLNSTERNG